MVEAFRMMSGKNLHQTHDLMDQLIINLSWQLDTVCSRANKYRYLNVYH
jgi:hypothetical protein